MAAGLLNSSRQVGTALIIAALTTIAAARTGSMLAGGASKPEALADGCSRAIMLMAVAAALIAVTAVVVLPRRAHELARDQALSESLA